MLLRCCVVRPPSLVPLSLARRFLFRRATCNVRRGAVQLSSFVARRCCFIVVPSLCCCFIVPRCCCIVVPSSLLQHRTPFTVHCAPAVRALFAVGRSLSTVVGQSSVVLPRYVVAVSLLSLLHRSSFIVVASSLVLHRRPASVTVHSPSLFVHCSCLFVRCLSMCVLRSPFVVCRWSSNFPSADRR